MLGSVAADNSLGELTERELEAAVGGATTSILEFKHLPSHQEYGSVEPPDQFQY